MTKYFITGDAFSFYSPDNYMLSTFENGKIIGLKDSSADTTSNTIYSTSDSSEVYGCELVVLKSENEAFIYNLSTIEENKFKLILTFDLGTDSEYIAQVIAEATDFHSNKDSIIIETVILDKKLFYTDIEKLNKELEEHSLIYSINNGLNDINPQPMTNTPTTIENTLNIEDEDFPF